MNKVQDALLGIMVLVILSVISSCSSELDEKKRAKQVGSSQSHTQVAQQAQPVQPVQPAPQAKTVTPAQPVQQPPQSQSRPVDQPAQRAIRTATTPDEVYRENCGACHPSYAPDLLPSASWEKILARPDDHFGESFELEVQAKNTILGYLRSNSAERSGSKKASKILGSLGGRTPVRITEIPYIQNKHRKIPPEVFKRPSIGSFSRCSACHMGVDRGGRFSKHSIRIPG